MKEVLKNLEDLDFYSYEEPTLVPIIQALQLNNNSVWLTDGRYKRLDTLSTILSPEADELMCNAMDDGDEFLYLYRPLPLHRCFFFDKEDLYEYPPMIFEDDYLCKSLRRYGIIVEDINEYEDFEGNLHLISNIGDFLICPAKFRYSFIHNCLKWQVVIARILLMLNVVLSQVGSNERFYVLREEDEEGIIVVLLDSPIFNFLHETKEIEESCLPKPIETYFESILL
ncbi:hypothetical protein [Kamptonema sp. UHCC 0994]|uniref:hypothetical protein n=1 Tax=Kamptonema sp. UHCC 0994 TaxID=3031329 RepID=UPI0023B9DD17|nr:hypothetical protein [Kamptonema sp. UHCC 0994]MDF0551595.1 hypothetical protein [Kamptonema sp. UHCC 0994]